MKKSKRIVAIIVCLMLVLTIPTQAAAIGRTGGSNIGGGGGGMGFFDGLDAFGNTTGTIGCILNVGSALVNADWSDPGSACLGLVDAVFGTSFGGDPTQDMLDSIYNDVSEIKQTTNQIKQSVDYLVQNSVYVNQQLSVITSSLRTVNSQLVRQTQMLKDITDSLAEMDREMRESFADLKAMIEDQTETLTSVVYSSTTEIEKTTALNNALQSYMNEYSKLYTSEMEVLQMLTLKQNDYQTFYNKVAALEDGAEILEALAKITLDDRTASSLTQRQQELLANNSVKIGSSNQNVLKYHLNYVDDLMDYITGTSTPSESVYTLNGTVDNIRTTTLAMGDYLTASNEDLNKLTGNKGIGEMYYIYCTYSEADSTIVHKKYRAFMDSMVARYMTTAWLAEMVYGYQIAAEANGNNNYSKIRRYESYLNNIHAQMVKVLAYYDYEYKQCVNNYDYGGDISGHGLEVVKYGNAVNKGAYSVTKKNILNYPSGMSENDIKLSLGEEFDLHFFYKYSDVSSRKGIVWTSNNPTVAAVGNNGTVIGLARGVATITAEYLGETASCQVSIGDSMAIKNSDGKNRYHFLKYTSTGEDWEIDDSLSFEMPSGKDGNIGYDYYYGITTYLADTVNLSESVKSASVTQTTGLTEAEMDAFTWVTAGDQAAQLNGYEISAVSGGWSEVIGYKKDETNHTFDFIGIPVYSSMETLHEAVAVDYSEYTEISTAEELIALSNNPEGWGMDAKYVLTADIDLGGIEWSPIGYCVGFGPHKESDAFLMDNAHVNNMLNSWAATKAFKGIFDGNGHTVSNFKITQIPHLKEALAEYNALIKKGETFSTYSGADSELCLAQAGLFGLVYGGSITNLSVADVDIDIDTSRGVKYTDENGNLKDFKLGDKTVVFADSFAIYAGGLTGANFWDPLWSQMEKYTDKYYVNGSMDETKLEAFKAEVDIPGYFSEMLDQNLNENHTQDMLDQYGQVLAYYGALEDCKTVVPIGMVGCYANGNVKVTNNASEGLTYSGILAGGSSADLDDCTAVGSVNSKGAGGANGGLVGVQYELPQGRLENCTSYAEVNATGGAAAGGLVGALTLPVCYDTNISFPKTVSSDAEREKMIDRLDVSFFAMAVMRVLGTAISSGCYTMDDANSYVIGNEVLGSVSGQGSVGGLAGSKNSGGMYSSIFHYDVDNDTGVYEYYNSCISQNYVACDVTSQGGIAGGLIGDITMGMDDEHTASGGDGYTVKRGEFTENYYTGKVNAGAGSAAGLIGMTNLDYSDLKLNISAATEIKGDTYKAYAINGRENGVSIVTATATDAGGTMSIKGALCFNGISAGDDKTSRGDAATFNNPATYTAAWGKDNFLDLSGGVKSDGTVGLDLLGGIVPTKLAARYRFPVETVPQSYNQGEAFVPVTEAYEYTGTGINLIKSGVTSTTPDMTKLGIQTVTLTYGDYTYTYDIKIYPSAGYLKVTTMPKVKKDGSGLSGGKVTLYENNSATGKEYDIDSCKVTKGEDGVFIIKKNNYTTALRAIFVDVFTNSLKKPVAEYVGTEYYAPGASADISALVPDTKTYNGNTYQLGGTSQDVKFTAEKDVCILSFYAKASTKSIAKATVTGLGNKTYTGKAIKPTVTVKLSGTKLTKGTDYAVTYSNNKNVGKAKVTIKGKGKYSGTITKNFKIIPKGTTISSVTGKSKALVVKWKKQSTKMSTARITGYKIMIATNSAFTKGKKTITVKGYSKTSKTITGIKAKTKYYVKISTYKTISGVTYQSKWSKATYKKTT